MLNSKEFTIHISEKYYSKRLDFVLSKELKDFSRVKIQTHIKNGNVSVNDHIITNCSFIVKNGVICLKLPLEKENQISILPNESLSKVEIDVIFEDEHLMVINKQPYLTVHPGNGNQTDTLVNILMAKNIQLSNIATRPGIVHRLDKDTSGLMIIAKTDKAHYLLSEQFARRSVKKKYTAICYSVPNPIIGTIDANIDRSKKDRKKMQVVRIGGRESITHYKLIKTLLDGKISIVESILETGRTHQIRVHFDNRNNGIIGDPVYNNSKRKYINTFNPLIQNYLKNFNRQALHSTEIEFLHPITEEMQYFKANLPEDILTLLQNLLKTPS